MRFMKFAEDNLNEGYFITSYEPKKLMVNGRTISSRIIIAPDQLIEDWSIESIDELSSNHTDDIIQFKPELVLIGTGNKLTFPDVATYSTLINMGIGVDVMDTGAACRTYNILSGEGRRVVAGLILIQ